MTTEKPHWSEQAERGSMIGMSIMLWLHKVGGRTLFRIALFPVMVYFFLFVKTARRASYEFLTRVYDHGGSCFSQRPGYRQVFRHFLVFGESILDKLAVWSGHIGNDSIVFSDREAFRARIKTGHGGVILVSHLGNLEVCRAMCRQTPELRLNVLVHTHHAEKFNGLLNRINPESSLTFFQVSDIGPDTAVILKQKVDRGEFLAIVGDRIPISSQRTCKVPFLGKEAQFPQGAFILASLMKCPVYTLFCVKQSGQFHIDVSLFSERLKLQRQNREAALSTYTAEYAQKLEWYALNYPYQWYNFYPFWGDT